MSALTVKEVISSDDVSKKQNLKLRHLLAIPINLSPSDFVAAVKSFPESTCFNVK